MRSLATIGLEKQMLVINWKHLILELLKFVDFRQKEPPCNGHHYNQEK